MHEIEAMEIRPSRESVERDIKIFLGHHMSRMGKCEHTIAHWTLASANNFLWSRLIIQIMQGGGYTCDEDIEEALMKFPKGLTGCYSRSLEQLSKRSNEERELAR